jgi:hypothetical protein
MNDSTAGVKTHPRDNLYESGDHDDILHEEHDDKCQCNVAFAVVEGMYLR